MTKSFSGLKVKIDNQMLKQGLCECHLSPMGSGGLDGFYFGSSCKFQHMSSDRDNKPYYRVYPDSKFSTYYETCSERRFLAHFKITEVTND